MSGDLDCEALQAAFNRWNDAAIVCRGSAGPVWIISTPSLRPGGGLIDVTVETLGSGQLRVSDGGDTLERLELDGFEVSTAGVLSRLEDAAAASGLEVMDGQIVGFGDSDQAPWLAARVTSAVIQADALVTSLSGRRGKTFSTKVKDLLDERFTDVDRGAKLPTTRRPVTAHVTGTHSSAWLDAVSGTAKGERLSSLFASAWTYTHEPDISPWQKFAVLRSPGSDWSRSDLLEVADACVVVTWDHRRELPEVLASVVNEGAELLSARERVFA